MVVHAQCYLDRLMFQKTADLRAPYTASNMELENYITYRNKLTF